MTLQELERTASRFLRECADPSSSTQTIHRDARLLYQWLVAPFAHRLDPARTLVIEPDGAIGAIPIQALMDENSRYVGERFPVTFSGGVVDYLARAGTGSARAMSAVVVAGPTLGTQMSRTFPPLPQTLREGRSVAARFQNSVLLTHAQATLRALEHSRPQAELFHFAGHGFSNATTGASAGAGARLRGGRDSGRETARTSGLEPVPPCRALRLFHRDRRSSRAGEPGEPGAEPVVGGGGSCDCNPLECGCRDRRPADGPILRRAALRVGRAWSLQQAARRPREQRHKPPRISGRHFRISGPAS